MKEVFRLPDVGEGIAEAEIVDYLVGIGSKVAADQPIVSIETDKAVVELPSPFTGTVVDIPHKPGDIVRVHDSLIVIETLKQAASVETSQEKLNIADLNKPAAAKIAQNEDTHILATPHTRRLARELSVDLNKIVGSGSHGRITDDDVKTAMKTASPPLPKSASSAAKYSSSQPPSTAGFDFEKYGTIKREPLKGIRKRTAETMSRSVSTIPHVTHFDEADVSELMAVLEKEKQTAEQRGIKLTLLSILMKATADALQHFPILNSSLDENSAELVLKEYINIGFATDTDAGLIVPVARAIDKKSILQIAKDLQTLSEKARNRSIDLEEMRGGTFTITNVGALGGKWATPIIVHPQVAILCSLRAEKRPVVRDDKIVIRTMLPLTLSFDHRVLDGADAARFVRHIIELLEDPMRMLVEVI